MTKPEVRINLNGATELLNRRIPASCKHQSRSHAEGRESGKWIGLLCPLGFRDSLIVSPHRRQEPTVVRVSVRIVGTQFNGSFEFLFRCGPIPVIPVRDDRHGNVSPRIGFVDGERPLGRILGLRARLRAVLLRALPRRGSPLTPSIRGVVRHRKGFEPVLIMDCVDVSWTRMELRSISTAATPSKFSETCNMRIMYRVFFWLFADSQM